MIIGIGIGRYIGIGRFIGIADMRNAYWYPPIRNPISVALPIYYNTG